MFMSYLLCFLILHVKSSIINPWSGCPQDPQIRSGNLTCIKFYSLDCPTGWSSFDTNCYVFVNFPLATFSTANADCLVCLKIISFMNTE